MPRYSNWNVILLTEDEIRTKFDAGTYSDLAEAGVLSTLLAYDKHRQPPTADLPDCTRSQRVSFRDEDGKIHAEAHRFLLPNGEVGGSGLLDPKVIYDHNTHTIYELRRD